VQDLRCPAQIVAFRAFVASTSIARYLRQRELALRVASAASLTGFGNIPLGMVREHTDKFSLNWIVVVHASIPFVATWRRATNVPNAAIALTIMAAIAGQQFGAMLERARLEEEAVRVRATVAATAAAAATAAPPQASSRTKKAAAKDGGAHIAPWAPKDETMIEPTILSSLTGGNSGRRQNPKLDGECPLRGPAGECAYQVNSVTKIGALLSKFDLFGFLGAVKA